MQNVNESRLLSLFKKLVETDSPSGREREVCDIIINELNKTGICVLEDRAGERIGGNAGNLYAYIDGDLKLSPLLLSAHLDTVEPSANKKCIIEKDGTIHSDGETVLGADDFAGVSAIIEALNVLKENNIPHRPLEVLFSVSEENYCKGISEFNFKNIRSKEAYVFDLSGRVGTAAYAAPTILSFKAKISGRASHAGFAPDKGIHSVKAAAEAVSKINCGRIDSETTVNIGTICGGCADNIVPEACVLTGEIRSYSDEKAVSQYELISNIINKTAEELGAGAEISFVRSITAYKTDLNNAVVCRFKKACADLKLQPELIRSFGGSDNNVFALNRITGIVAATAMNACHTTEEWTTKDELKKAAELAYRLMISKE